MKLQDNKLIAIGGLKNSGKDEASKMLQYCLSVPRIFRYYYFYKYVMQTKMPLHYTHPTLMSLYPSNTNGYSQCIVCKNYTLTLH